ncbi:MAG: HAMP domain-containing histidine kinase [Solirubrobacterales bacterium]|nr:HAMP domain-containing histidine kinase [Solirubrobacterales bacterium]
MRLNPSLTTRLRVGFIVLFAMLLVVSLLGVARLFQIRVDFEDQTQRYSDLDVKAAQMQTAFATENAAVTAFRRGGADQAQLRDATAAADRTDAQALQLAAGDSVRPLVRRRIAAEEDWRRRVADPLLRGGAPSAQAQRESGASVEAASRSLAAGVDEAKDASRDRAHDRTRNTTILVAAGLAAALLAALILFSGLINSMRAPLARLVGGARRLAGGDLETRVKVGGPVEIAILGRAFNEMAAELERDARERDRLERMKDDFVLTVSHELRTPVTVVKGFAEMLTAEKGDLNSRQREAAEVISDSAGQLQKMINDLLDLARSDAGKLRIETEPVSVRTLVQNAARRMKPEFEEKGQRLTVSVESELPKVMADPHRIGQVLSNLLTNANRYAPEKARVRLTAAGAGRQVEFAVSDDGPGLDEEELEHVFERFWRADSGESQEVGGTGIGLAIAQSLIELHKGEISAASEPGEGASFRFLLPTVSEKANGASGDGAKPARKPTQRSAAKSKA